MAYWRLRRTFTVPDVLGFSLASSGNPGIDGDYYRTSQTCNNAPVFHCSAKGLYLFYSYGTESGWFLKDSVETSMEDWEDPSGMKPYSGMLEIPWDYEGDATRPDAAMLSGTWYRNDGQTGNYSVTASELLDTACPLLDSSGTDGFGHVRRFPSSLDIPREGLVFDAPLASQAAKALTGQALTYALNYTGSGDVFFEEHGLRCMRTLWAGSGEGSILVSFPETGLPSGNAARTVSTWVYPTAGLSEEMLWMAWGDNASSAHSGFGVHGGSNSGMPLFVHGYSNDQAPGGSIPLNQWSHVAFMAAHGRVCAFINGVFSGETGWGIDTKLTGTAYLGGDNFGRPFEGRIAGVRVYNRVLSEAEIQRLFNEHKEVVP